MGSCFSSFTTAAVDAQRPTAKVIDIDGSLKEYSEAVRAAHVLGRNHPSCFLCNADSLFYGHFIKSLGSNQFIEMDQLYFVLPVIVLEKPLTGANMANLAVSASSALAAADALMKRETVCCLSSRRKVVQVTPVIMEPLDDDEYERFNEVSVGSWKSSCRAEKKEKKKSSRPKLSAIEEVAE